MFAGIYSCDLMMVVSISSNKSLASITVRHHCVPKQAGPHIRQKTLKIILMEGN